MRVLRALLWRFRGLFRREQRDREFGAEIEANLRMHIEDNVRSGMSKEEARRQALIRLGGVEATKEMYRERRGLPLMETVLQDLRFACRTLRKNLAFTTIAVLTLALGIGANTAIFSMVNALLLHPYNFPQLDRLVRVWENSGVDEGVDARRIAAPDAADLLSRATVFDALSTYRCGDFNLNAEGNVEPVRGCAVSSNFFDVLGVSPASGRAFSATEEQAGADQVAVVSYGFSQRHFAGDPALIGKMIQMNGKKYAIVGIMPRGFDYPVPMELWVPLSLSPTEKTDRAKLSLEALGMLGPGISVAQAQSAIDSVSRRLQQEYPATNANRRTKVLQLRKELYVYTLPLFSLLQVAAVFVLLLACANLANLLFARMFGRQKRNRRAHRSWGGPRTSGSVVSHGNPLVVVYRWDSGDSGVFLECEGVAHQHFAELDDVGSRLGWNPSGRLGSYTYCAPHRRRWSSVWSWNHGALPPGSAIRRAQRSDPWRDAWRQRTRSQCTGDRAGDARPCAAGVRRAYHAGVLAAREYLSRISGGQCHARGNTLAQEFVSGQRANRQFLRSIFTRKRVAARRDGRSPGDKQPGKQCRQRDNRLHHQGPPSAESY
jgi:hypothetical protein